jgi:hypothetical protein
MADPGRTRQKVCDGVRVGLTYSSSAFSGLPTSVATKLDVKDTRDWLESPMAHAGDRMLCAFLDLRRIEVRVLYNFELIHRQRHANV